MAAIGFEPVELMLLIFLRTQRLFLPEFVVYNTVILSLIYPKNRLKKLQGDDANG